MITNLFITFVLIILTSIFSLLPVVNIASLPLIGPVLSSSLSQAVSVWNAFLVTFPYASIAWQVFLYVILPFELLMLIAKFFLGHRLPAHTN